MSDDAETDEPKKKGGMMPILIAVVAALVLGGGAGAAVFMGLVPLGGGEKSDHGDDGHGGAKKKKDDGHGKAKDSHGGGHGEKGGDDALYTVAIAGDVAFVNLEPLVISLGPQASARHLKLTLSLETDADAAAGVEMMIPRVRDVLNTYLRAVEITDLEDPTAMTRLRAQMTRRVRMVTPPDAVNDVLILEFVLN